MTDNEAINMVDKAIKSEFFKKCKIGYDLAEALGIVVRIATNATKNSKPYDERTKGDWIHITSRPMTDEEYDHYSSEIGDCPKEECRVYTCQLPEDCEEVLITTRWEKVCEDIFHQEIDSCFFEDHEDPDDVIAWMKKPQPYRESEEEKND